MRKFFLICIYLCVSVFAQKQDFMILNGEPKYKTGFKHFEYVNPKAKKGGVLKIDDIGTFDSLNPYVLKGSSAAGINMIYDTLMTPSLDEPITYYPLVAEFVEISPKNDWVKFYINKKARFHDGKEVTADDVKFSFDILMSKGSPHYKRYYSDIKDVVVENKYIVKFNFKRDNNKELPLILAQIPILPKHFWQSKDFLDSDTIIPIGSGPYKIDKYKFAKFISYKLYENYWAKNLNVNIGQNNFGKIRFDYYKDRMVTLEAFKAGELDYRIENVAKNWATLYVGKQFENGSIIKQEIPHQRPSGMQAFMFNLRKPLFQDLQVRKALNLVFDFEWTNKKLFYSQYKRTNSFFDNCELKPTGLPSSEELKLLELFKSELPKEVFGPAYKSNVTKGDGNIRSELRQASKILRQAGWKFKDNVLVKNGKKFEFEILLASRLMEKILNPYVQNLKKIGVIAKIRTLDEISYVNKITNFDYDMILSSLMTSLSPGNELKNYWGSKSADIKGSRNFIGIKSKAVDFLIDKIITAPTRKELIVATKALDRVLMHNYYLIPTWHISSYRLAYQNKFEQPKIAPKYGLGIFTWWFKEEYLK